MLSFFKKIRNFIWYSIFVLLIMTGFQYLICPIYHFPDSAPFAGVHWYNPYQNLNLNWYKTNFHVHSKCWLGLTSGRDRPDEIFRHYRRLGYDLIAISNYQSINTLRDTTIGGISAYEHGYNIGKFHQIIIGAERVAWKDFIFLRNRNHKQHTIKDLKKEDVFVILAHPGWYNAITAKDVAELTDADAIEIFNANRQSLDLWDHALSAGKVLWTMGNDDSHDINRKSRTGVCWTMICARSKQKKDILQALRNGAMYSVKGENGSNDNALLLAQIENGTFSIKLNHPAQKIIFYGQNGIVRKTVKNIDHAFIDLDQQDTYIRTEIRNEHSIMLLNPIIRYNDLSLQLYSATVNHTMTWVQRLIFVVCGLGVLYIISLIQKRKQKQRLEKKRKEIIDSPKSRRQKRKVEF